MLQNSWQAPSCIDINKSTSQNAAENTTQLTIQTVVSLRNNNSVTVNFVTKVFQGTALTPNKVIYAMYHMPKVGEVIQKLYYMLIC